MTDFTVPHTPHTAKPALIERFTATVRGAWRALNKERRVRSTLFTLDRLSDHSLRDIGLERDNIEPVVRSRCETDRAGGSAAANTCLPGFPRQPLL